MKSQSSASTTLSVKVPLSPSNKLLSPTHRGITFPPTSPRSLRRGIPVPQSRNPPLIKTKHIVETAPIGGEHS